MTSPQENQALPSLDGKSFDIVILGTGLSESILAAALSLAGSTVLHLDPADHYGSTWSTLTLENFLETIDFDGDALINHPDNRSEHDPISGFIELSSREKSETMEEAFHFDPIAYAHPSHTISVFSSVNQKISSPQIWSNIGKQKFLVDLTLAPILAQSELIHLLIASNAGHYIQFKPLEACFLYNNYEQAKDDPSLDKAAHVIKFNSALVQKVPLSRSDIFQTPVLTIVEKRLFMKFLTMCYEHEYHESLLYSNSALGNNQGSRMEISQDLTFTQLMKNQKLTDKLQYIIINVILGDHAYRPGPESRAESLKQAYISTTNDMRQQQQQHQDISAADGIFELATYLKSLLRYKTPTPVLVTNYGSGELPQAFCRVCAVFGGTYALRNGIKAVISSSSDSEGTHKRVVVTSKNERIRTKNVFASILFKAKKKEVSNHTLRYIAITRKRLSYFKEYSRAICTFPMNSLGCDASFDLVQLDSSLNTIPDDCYVYYGYARDISMDQFEKALNLIIDESIKVWEVIYSLRSSRNKVTATDYSYGAEQFVTWLGRADNVNDAILEAKECLKRIYPEKEFFSLPVKETQSTNKEHGS